MYFWCLEHYNCFIIFEIYSYNHNSFTLNISKAGKLLLNLMCDVTLMGKTIYTDGNLSLFDFVNWNSDCRHVVWLYYYYVNNYQGSS